MKAGRNSRCNFLRGLAPIVNKFLIWCAYANQPSFRPRWTARVANAVYPEFAAHLPRNPDDFSNMP
jgi:hypothetical protein